MDRINLTYINNLASRSNKFRYLLKKEEYNSIIIEYKEKEIAIIFEKEDLEVNPLQMKLFIPKKN